jgi:hypothetical protein
MIEFRNKASLPFPIHLTGNLNIEALHSQSGKLSLPALERCKETILIRGMAQEKQKSTITEKHIHAPVLNEVLKITSFIFISFPIPHNTKRLSHFFYNLKIIVKSKLFK